MLARRPEEQLSSPHEGYGCVGALIPLTLGQDWGREASHRAGGLQD